MLALPSNTCSRCPISLHSWRLIKPAKVCTMCLTFCEREQMPIQWTAGRESELSHGFPGVDLFAFAPGAGLGLHTSPIPSPVCRKAISWTQTGRNTSQSLLVGSLSFNMRKSLSRVFSMELYQSLSCFSRHCFL